VARHSVLWIGNGDEWVERELDRLDSVELTWNAPGQPVRESFDLALLEDGDSTEAELQTLRQQPGRPHLLVVCDRKLDARRQQLLEAGADQVVVAPRDHPPQTFRDTVESCLERLARARRPRTTRTRSTEPAIPGVIAESSAFRATLQLAQRAAHSTATVLVSGETGSGKEIVAHSIHSLGPRAARPFVAINCAAFPDTLLESELFGHVRGAFTGADRDKLGLFEEADGGTLFLDEIGETAPPMQAKLLRALQQREIRPVGGTRVRRIDVRVIAASNRDLEGEALAGRFRVDLFYRLAVFPVSVPPLRERQADILPLAEHFLEHHGIREATPGCDLGASAQKELLGYGWPGNVRELENEMLRALALAEPGERLSASQLSHRLLHPRQDRLGPGTTGSDSLRSRVAGFERIVIREVLDKHQGQRTATARALGLTREGLHKKMKRLGIV